MDRTTALIMVAATGLAVATFFAFVLPEWREPVKPTPASVSGDLDYRDYTVYEGQMLLHVTDTGNASDRWDCTLVTEGPVPNEVTFKNCVIPRWIIEEAAERGLEVR